MITENRLRTVSAVMLRCLTIAMLLSVPLWSYAAISNKFITLKVESCEGSKGVIAPGGSFSCKVTLEPKDASATVPVYSPAIEAPLAEEIVAVAF